MAHLITCPHPQCGQSFSFEPTEGQATVCCLHCGREISLTQVGRGVARTPVAETIATPPPPRESEQVSGEAPPPSPAPAGPAPEQPLAEGTPVPPTPGSGTENWDSPPPSPASKADLSAIIDRVEQDAIPRSASVPGYEIEKELGRGGMGVVYQARQLNPRRRVALKMLLGGEHADPRHRALFQAEAEVVAALQHPNVVQIFEVGQHQGLPFLALEFCPGESLADRLGRGPLPVEEVVLLVETLARAIHEAHRRGIIHRDLKPANVLLGEDGSPKVTDFGLAKRLDDERDQSRTGTVMGTPGYMAPEQAGGRVHEIGPGTDVYALGVILFECLTGRPPFEGPRDLVLFHALETEPPSPRKFNRKVPRDLETICLKCLHKQGHRRYGSAEELAEDLRRFREREPIEARPVGRLERLVKWMMRKPAEAAVCVLLPLVFLLTAGWVGAAWIWHQVEVAKEQVEQSREVLQRASKVKTHFSAMQAAKRGHHLLGEKEFRHKYERHHEAFRQDIAALRELVQNDETQVARVDEVIRLEDQLYNYANLDFAMFEKRAPLLNAEFQGRLARLHLRQLVKLDNQIQEKFDELIVAEVGRLQEGHTQVQRAMSESMEILSLLLASAIVLALLIPCLLSSSVARVRNRLLKLVRSPGG
jgi:serine/threonine protein kinase/CHASE3 domain sensor protein